MDGWKIHFKSVDLDTYHDYRPEEDGLAIWVGNVHNRIKTIAFDPGL